MKSWLLLFIFIFLVSCSQNSDPLLTGLDSSLKLKKSESLRYALPNEPTGFDWSKTGDMQASWMQSLIMSGLVRWNFSGGSPQIEPALATQWESSDNNRVWRFTLRKDVKWSDGVPFTSQHVYDGILRTLNPMTAALDSAFLYPILNAEKYNQGQLTDPTQVGVRIIDEHNIEITTEKPYPLLPMRMAVRPSFPVRMDLIEKYGDQWHHPENMVSLGPYLLKRWKNNEFVFLERNPTYWDTSASIKNVVLYIVENAQTRLNMFRKGKLDFISHLPLDQIKSIKKNPGYWELPALGTTYLGFNVTQSPFDNKFLRKAFSLAIDKKELVKAISQAHNYNESWISPLVKDYLLSEESLFSPVKAQKALSLSGYTAESLKGKILFGFNTNNINSRLVENVQNQIKRNLGIEVELEGQEWKTYLQRLESKKRYAMFRLGWGGVEPDPHNYMALLLTNYSQNKTGWSNKQFDQYIDQAFSEANVEKRKGLYEKANQLITREEYPVLPILSHKYRALVSPRVKDFQLNVMEENQVYRWKLAN